MIRKIIVLGATIWLFAGQILYAQKKIYSLEQVFEKTLWQYPSLSSKEFQIQRQKLSKELIKREQLPELNFQGQQSYGSYQGVSGAFFPLPGMYNTSGSKGSTEQPSSISNLYGSSVLQWDFLQFGRIKSKLKVADAAVELSSTALSREKLRLQTEVAQQYFNALKNQALLSVSRADVQRVQDLFELAEAQANAGLKPGADTLLIKSNYFQVKGQVNDHQAELETAMLELAALIGEDVKSFTIDSSLFTPHKISNTLPISDSINEHPYLQSLKAEIDYANAKLNAEKREPYPSVGLLAGVGIRGSGIHGSGLVNQNLSAPWKDNTGSYLLGIAVTWNLSSLYNNRLKQKITGKEIQSARADYEEASIQLQASYSSAVSRFKQQRENVLDAATALDASKQGYELYVTRYTNGLINLVELLQLQKTLQDAENNYVKATAAYWDELINQSKNLGNMSLLLSQITH
ncbi:MAG: TolC family protein [Ginsengibacter sp.]